MVAAFRIAGWGERMEREWSDVSFRLNVSDLQVQMEGLNHNRMALKLDYGSGR